MRHLFHIGIEPGTANGKTFVRPSARGILIQNGKVAMVHSLKYDYYKFPGGGIEPEETAEDALIREVAEEAGLRVLPDSIQEYGLVTRIVPSDQPDVDYFIQDNFYYLCCADAQLKPQKLDDYEADEGFTLEYVTAEKAIRVNRTLPHGPKEQTMLEREALVLERLCTEGLL